MKALYRISQDEMISIFLKGEIGSHRFGGGIWIALEKFKFSPNLIKYPNLEDSSENARRKAVFEWCRFYIGEGNLLVSNEFPVNIEWNRGIITRDELSEIRYHNSEYWSYVSSDTRLAKDFAQKIRESSLKVNDDHRPFLDAATSVKNKADFEEIILVATDLNSYKVVVEGHLRLTAYCLAIDYVPKTLSVIIGFSPNFKQWRHY